MSFTQTSVHQASFSYQTVTEFFIFFLYCFHVYVPKQECYFYGAVLVGYTDKLDLFKGLIEIWGLSQEMIHSAIHLLCPPPSLSYLGFISL